MNRRDAIRCLMATGLYSLMGPACRNVQTVSKPNIVIINIDDMGWKDTGFMGTSYYETPHIDALSRHGTIFTNGYASAANCAPSRACLMTGQWSQRHGIYTVGSSERGKSTNRKIIPTPNTTTLADGHLTIPEVLRGQGYLTCHAGKWHLNDDPLTQGFDHNIGGNHMRMAGRFMLDPRKASRRGLPLRYSYMVHIICWPLLFAYGYLKN